MKTTSPLLNRVVLATLLAISISSTGCMTAAMKGTPLFSGEYKNPRGPSEDRVPLWPLLYYRDPALSVLWPFIESVRGESLAVRPIFSVYNKDDDAKRQTNVLWPLSQFDNASGVCRIFPVYWGNNFAAVFPLYWHYEKAYGPTDLMIPLWFYQRDATGSNMALLLGLIGWINQPSSHGWHVFPIAGNYDGPGRHYSYQLWPLFHQVRRGGESLNMGLPLWFWSRDDTGSRFLSPLWSQGIHANGTSWRLLLPFFYSDDHSFYTLLGGGGNHAWAVPVLLSWGSSQPDGSRGNILGPLAHWERRGDGSTSYAFPLYYQSRDASARRFYSLPWSSAEHKNGEGWRLIPPLYFHSHDRDGRLTLSPLYYAGTSQGGKASWNLVPPLYFGSATPNGTQTITPLYATGRSADGASAWRLLVPLFYSERDREGKFWATLLGGRSTEAGGHAWMVYPLLTWSRRHGTASDMWALAPLAHFYSDEHGSRSHVLPLYYHDSASGTLITLPYSHWTGSGKSNALIPPLLAWKQSGGGYVNWWLMAGLARIASGPQAGASYAVPFYYRNPATGTLLSPLICAWKKDQKQTFFIPPLFSGYLRDGAADGTRELVLLGLYDHEWNCKGTQSDALLPLYAWAPHRYFYTLLAGWNREGEKRFAYYLTPIIGSLRNKEEQKFWVFPLYHRAASLDGRHVKGRFLWALFSRDGEKSHSIFFPFYNYTDHGKDTPSKFSDALTGTEFWCLPWCWRHDTREYSFTNWDAKKRSFETHYEDVDSTGAFPFFHRTRTSDDLGHRLETSSLLLRLFDRRHEIAPDANRPTGVNDYYRSRVLWHAWHYEKLNGDVSADLFPGLAWDRKTDGSRQFSFLWRFYRYARDGAGRRKLDILFIPIIRDAKN